MVIDVSADTNGNEQVESLDRVIPLNCHTTDERRASAVNIFSILDNFRAKVINWLNEMQTIIKTKKIVMGNFVRWKMGMRERHSMWNLFDVIYS